MIVKHPLFRSGLSALVLGLVAAPVMAQPSPAPKAARAAAKPTITRFNPVSGKVNDWIYISGTNLENGTVDFNGTKSPRFDSYGTYGYAKVPPGATTGKIRVTTSYGAVSTINNFTVLPDNPNAPTISSFTPTRITSTNVWILIYGTNLKGSTVAFNGTKTDRVDAYDTYAYALVPAGATTGRITVTNTYGTATSGVDLVIDQPAGPPTLESFTPAHGSVGTTVTLTGTNLANAAVTFNGVAAAITSNSATEIVTSVPDAAATGPIVVATAGGKVTSTTTFMVDPPPFDQPVISAVSPTSGLAGTKVTITGTYLSGATVKFNNTTAVVASNSATQVVTTVPAGATTGPLTVTTGVGKATWPTFTVINPTTDYSISKVLIGQATQRSSGNMRLAQDKRGFVQVYAVCNETNTARPDVKVVFSLNGTVLHTATIPAPAGNAGVPTTAPAYGDFTKTYVAVVPAAAIKPGVTATVTLDPAGSLADANKANNTWTGKPDVRNTYPFRITFVPIQIYYGGSWFTGSVTSSNVDTFLDMFQHIWPVPETIDRKVHSAYYTQNIPKDDYSSGWEAVLNELGALQVAEGTRNRYYYGVYNPYYNSGGTGMAWLGSPQSMGIEWTSTASDSTFSWRAGTVAHEVGHSLNRNHTNCGGAGNPDPYYPYAGGKLGTPGFDCWTNKVYSASSYYDVMGYCGYTWVSDYCVDKVMDFRLSGDITVPGPIAVNGTEASETKPCRLIWGTIEGGEVKLNPTFTLDAVPTTETPDASFNAELVSASGAVLGRMAFEPTEASHTRTGNRGFVLAVPIQGAVKGVSGVRSEQPMTIRVTRNGETLATRTASAMRTGNNLVAEPAPRAVRIGDRIRLTWDGDVYPMVMVKNPTLNEVISFARGGEVDLPCTEKTLEVHLSDGSGSHAVQVNVE